METAVSIVQPSLGERKAEVKLHVKLKLKLAWDFLLGSLGHFGRCPHLPETKSHSSFSFALVVLHVDPPLRRPPTSPARQATKRCGPTFVPFVRREITEIDIVQ